MLIVLTSCRVVWVLKELEPENWVNNGGTDFAVQLKAPNVQDVIQKVRWPFRLPSWGGMSCSGGLLRGLVGRCITQEEVTLQASVLQTRLSTQMMLFAQCKHSLIQPMQAHFQELSPHVVNSH